MSAKKLRASNATDTSARMHTETTEEVHKKSGRLLLTPGVRLHTRLTEQAAKEGVPLTRLILEVMSEYLGKVGG